MKRVILAELWLIPRQHSSVHMGGVQTLYMNKLGLSFTVVNLDIDTQYSLQDRFRPFRIDYLVNRMEKFV